MSNDVTFLNNLKQGFVTGDLDLHYWCICLLDLPKKYQLRTNPKKKKYSTNWLTDPVFIDFLDGRFMYLILLFNINH